jgi:hypothetical protein
LQVGVDPIHSAQSQIANSNQEGNEEAERQPQPNHGLSGGKRGRQWESAAVALVLLTHDHNALQTDTTLAARVPSVCSSAQEALFSREFGNIHIKTSDGGTEGN